MKIENEGIVEMLRKDGIINLRISLQTCKYLIWFDFAMLIGMFCAIHYVWFKMSLTSINIVFYIGVECWFGSLFYILNENYKQFKRDIKFFENRLNECEIKRKVE